jgi:tetratricopeptide (TPR) repeat protein
MMFSSSPFPVLPVLPFLRRGALLLASLLLVSCAAQSRLVAPPLAASARGDDADVEALVATFWGAQFTLPELEARVAQVIARHPGDARVEEIASFAAGLSGNGPERTRHLLAAAADLRGDATEVYLWEHNGDPSRDERAAWRRLHETLAAHHPRPSVRALATLRLMGSAEEEGRFDDTQRIGRALGFIGDWMLLGALENDQGKGFLTEYAPEKPGPPGTTMDLTAAVPGPLVPLAWRHATSARTGEVPLSQLLWPHEFALAYLVTWVHSDGERQAQLRLSSGGPVRAWCNDGLVLSEELVKRGDLDTLNAPVTLHAGWNKILVKSAHRRGEWWLRARITDGEGAALSGLAYSSAAQRYQPGPSRSDPSALPPPPFKEGPDNRRRFLESELQLRAGQDRAALSSLQSFLSESPRNLMAIYHGALLYWNNDELGRAIDLLDAGVSATGGRSSPFLSRRAEYYTQKQLYEKAQSDLTAAVALGPWTRGPQMKLAELYNQRGWAIDACRVLDGTLQRWPDAADTLIAAAHCAEMQGYDELALRRLDRALALEPGSEVATRRRLGIDHRHNDVAAIRRDLTRLRRIDPWSPEHVAAAGDLARRRGDFALAEREWRRATELAPEWPNAYAELGLLAYEQRRPTEALTRWKQAHERDPNNSAIAQRIELLEPTRLGVLEKYVPDDAAIERALALAPTKSAGAQSALLLDSEVGEVHNDGSWRRVVTSVATPFNVQGRDALTEVQLSKRGTLKVLRAYAISERGERQEASSIRGGQVRFRNLQIGSKVVLQYIEYEPPQPYLPGAMSTSWFFQDATAQLEDSSLVLLVPTGRTLHTQIIGHVLQKRSQEPGFEVYRFSAQHSPPLLPEKGMSPAIDLLAQVTVSTVDSWDDYARWERALLTDAFHTNGKIDALVDGLVAGAKSPREKLDRLFHYAAQEVRYQQDYENTIAGVRPHAASAVIERGYGDCKDKAVLLMQMARRVGVELRFAILRTTPAGKVRRDVPDQQFNHAIVYVPVQAGIDKPFFMDPTSDGLDMGNLRADDQGATALVMDPASGHWGFIDIPYQAPELQFDRHKIRIDVKSPSEVLATDDVQLRGMTAMFLRMVLRNEAMAKKAYEGLSSILYPGTTLRSGHAPPKEDTWAPVSLSLDVDASAALQGEETQWRLRLPELLTLPSVDIKQRETPLELGPPNVSHYDIEALVPEGYKIVRSPSDVTVEHACFTLSRHGHIEGLKLTMQVDLVRRCSDVSVADYGPFRAAVQRASHSLQEQLVFDKIEPPATTPAPKHAATKHKKS